MEVNFPKNDFSKNLQINSFNEPILLKVSTGKVNINSFQEIVQGVVSGNSDGDRINEIGEKVKKKLEEYNRYLNNYRNNFKKILGEIKLRENKQGRGGALGQVRSNNGNFWKRGAIYNFYKRYSELEDEKQKLLKELEQIKGNEGKLELDDLSVEKRKSNVSALRKIEYSMIDRSLNLSQWLDGSKKSGENLLAAILGEEKLQKFQERYSRYENLKNVKNRSRGQSWYFQLNQRAIEQNKELWEKEQKALEYEVENTISEKIIKELVDLIGLVKNSK
ncbi:hypothetical protein [Mycoplasma parvum]|uniref:Uncharacterized protein n=1 Tax=Mycoplasma parvum str. Indiana TaxID=1403316 RepID=U5NCQ2_9MOLU|nr:hypothetical protein [Mycoplasma parvum]AGX89207.1 hypothetical protein PRV_02350 [Mycoplasma parvum str. Indiana]